MNCTQCPVSCGADRTLSKGYCGVSGVKLAKYYLHPFEEPPISFKNGSGYTAGELIERAGMKGAACGGAFVSGAHANFIINGGGASAADCLALIGRIRAAVAASSRILLQEEICYIGDFA